MKQRRPHCRSGQCSYSICSTSVGGMDRCGDAANMYVAVINQTNSKGQRHLGHQIAGIGCPNSKSVIHVVHSAQGLHRVPLAKGRRGRHRYGRGTTTSADSTCQRHRSMLTSASDVGSGAGPAAHLPADDGRSRHGAHLGGGIMAAAASPSTRQVRHCCAGSIEHGQSNVSSRDPRRCPRAAWSSRCIS